MQGLKPIYYEVQNELNIDPLFVIKNKFHSVKSILDMEKLIKKYNKISVRNKNYIDDFKVLISKIFCPIDNKKIIKYLQK